jgi:ferredoxin-nitrite reductase
MAGADWRISAMVDFNNSGFSTEQTSYYPDSSRASFKVTSCPFLGQDAQAASPTSRCRRTVHGTPIEDLCREEQIKHEKHGLDCYDTILRQRRNQHVSRRWRHLPLQVPRPLFRHARPRKPHAPLPHRRGRTLQLTNSAASLKSLPWGPGHIDLTTRANVQVREIMPKDAPSILMKLADLGLTSQGAGADNVRNITATPTTGFDPTELLDVLPYARAIHHAILKNRDLFGLPRKFNISYDSGGAISTCTDTNDIGFYAVKVTPSKIKSQINNRNLHPASTSACSSAASPATSNSPPTAASCSPPPRPSPSPPP